MEPKKWEKLAGMAQFHCPIGEKIHSPPMVAHILVHVRANGKKNFLAPFTQFPLRVGLMAPPRENRANNALIKLLSSTLSIPQRFFTILQGKTCPLKRIRVEGINEEEMLQKLGSIR
jgi:uncharacterized protein YggU (UPF0235/DUF167 family)